MNIIIIIIMRLVLIPICLMHNLDYGIQALFYYYGGDPHRIALQ